MCVSEGSSQEGIMEQYTGSHSVRVLQGKRTNRVRFQFESGDQRTRGASDINPSLRAGGDEMRCLSSISYSGKEKNHSFLYFLFLFRLTVDWKMPTHIGEGDLLSPLIQMLISSRNFQKQCLIWAPVAHSC